MSEPQLLEEARAIRKGLRMLGRNRKVGLSMHQTLDLVEELEARAERMIAALGGDASPQQPQDS